MATLVTPLALILHAKRTYKRGPEVRVGEDCIDLPPPRLDGDVSLERSLANRRSIRDYLDEPLSIEEVSQLLWAAYGITETIHGFKTSPSAGATYPAEIYIVVGEKGVTIGDEGYLEPGSYHYNPHAHRICVVKKGELRHELYKAALEQEWVLKAPVSIVVTVVFERTTRRYGERGIRYVWIEVGHIGQNIYLQATALGLGTVAVGAFLDEQVKKIIGAPESHNPAYIMPVGRPVTPYTLDERELHAYIMAHREKST